MKVKRVVLYSSSCAPSSRRFALRVFLRRLIARMVFSVVNGEDAASVAHAERGLIAFRALTAERRAAGAELVLE